MKLGKGDKIEIDVSLKTSPRVTRDAVVISDGKKAVDELSHSGTHWNSLKTVTARQFGF